MWTCPRGDEAGALLDLQNTAQDWIGRVMEGNLWTREAQSENEKWALLQHCLVEATGLIPQEVIL